MKLLVLCFTMLNVTPLFSASSFNEVRNVVFGENPAATNTTVASEMKLYEQNRLPHYEVTSDKFIMGGINRLMDRATRTLKETDDYYPRLE
ncbi:MAG: hypothetical protein H7336_00510, partial [Bacteriovorax sp.]|nr:hypothetical protein [Bacteriovorax sp.]